MSGGRIREQSRGRGQEKREKAARGKRKRRQAERAEEMGLEESGKMAKHRKGKWRRQERVPEGRV